jgi:hypothetical protein
VTGTVQSAIHQSMWSSCTSAGLCYIKRLKPDRKQYSLGAEQDVVSCLNTQHHGVVLVGNLVLQAGSAAQMSMASVVFLCIRQRE